MLWVFTALCLAGGAWTVIYLSDSSNSGMYVESFSDSVREQWQLNETVRMLSAPLLLVGLANLTVLFCLYALRRDRLRSLPVSHREDLA